MVDLHIISLGMVNVYLLKGKKNILIDTGMKHSEEKIFRAITALGVSPDAIDVILLTHGHVDHSGSVSAIVSKTGAKVIMDETEYKTLVGEIPDDITPLNALTKLMFFIRSIGGKKQAPAPDFIPDILIKDTYDLNEFGIDGKIIRTPGHTKGSISVLLDNGAVIIGDNLMAIFSKKKPSKPMLAYDLKLIKKSIRTLIELGAKRFYISHGRDYSRDTIEKTLKRF